MFAIDMMIFIPSVLESANYADSFTQPKPDWSDTVYISR